MSRGVSRGNQRAVQPVALSIWRGPLKPTPPMPLLGLLWVLASEWLFAGRRSTLRLQIR
jgi:hypothetical protein